jgi:hypothetical protein
MGVRLPAGEHDAITITGWYGHKSEYNLMVFPKFYYIPEAIQYSNPDLLGGAWACGVAGGTNLTSSFSFNGFPFEAYTNHPDVSDVWPYGVYTVAGWSSNSVTLNLGGSDFAFGPGTFKQNCIAGGSGDCILTGTGLVSVGISRTPCHKMQTAEVKVISYYENEWRNYIQTNAIKFLAFRIQSDGTNHVYSINTRDVSGYVEDPEVSTNTCPFKFSSGGIYTIKFVGMYNSSTKEESTFDFRVFGTRLTDEQLERVFQNGRDEVIRRGL